MEFGNNIGVKQSFVLTTDFKQPNPTSNLGFQSKLIRTIQF